MSEITLYDQPDFKGKAKYFVSSVPDLSEKIFDDAAQSARVKGNIWVGFTEANYKGEFIIFGPGDYSTLGPNFNHKLSSLRMVTEDLMNPKIDLYENVNYGGKVREVTEQVDNLQLAGINEMVSSDIVKQGVWILHEGLNQTGPRLITYKGDQWPNYYDFGWNDKLSSLRPLVHGATEVGPTPSVKLQRGQ